MGPVGMQEIIVIFLVALVLFGPKKLPELGRTIGKAITEFRRAQSELKTTFESHMRELEKEHESIKEITSGYTSELHNAYQYDSPYHDSSHYDEPELHESTPATPTTVSEPAPQVAETTVSHEAPGNETVPHITAPEIAAEHHSNGSAAPESHSVNS